MRRTARHRAQRGASPRKRRMIEGKFGRSDAEFSFSAAGRRTAGDIGLHIGEFRAVKSAGNAGNIYAKADTSDHAVCAGCIGGKREKIRAAGAVQANNKEHLWNCTKDF